MKRFSSSFVIRGLQTNTCLLKWLNPKSDITKCCQDRNSHLFLRGMQNGTTALEYGLAVYYNVTHILLYDPAIMLLLTYLAYLKTNSHKYLSTNVYSHFVHIHQKLKPKQCPLVGKWINNCSTFMQWNVIQQYNKWAIKAQEDIEEH